MSREERIARKLLAADKPLPVDLEAALMGQGLDPNSLTPFDKDADQ